MWPAIIDGHAGLIVSAIGVSYVALRLLLQGRGNLTTARGLLQEAGVGTVLLGTLLALPAVLLPALLAVGARGALRLREGGEEEKANAAAGLAFLMLLVSLVLCPLLLVVPALGWGLWPAVRSARSRHRRRDRPPSEAGPASKSEDRQPKEGAEREADLGVKDFLSFASVAVLLLLLTSYRSWWPTEAIKVEGKPAMTAMVVADDGRDLVLLRDGNLRRVRSDRLESRQYCEPEDARLLAPLWELINPVSYPTCPV